MWKEERSVTGINDHSLVTSLASDMMTNDRSPRKQRIDHSSLWLTSLALPPFLAYPLRSRRR